MDAVQAMSAELMAIKNRYDQIESALQQLSQSVQSDGWNEQICERINCEMEEIRSSGQRAWLDYQNWPDEQRSHPALRDQMQQITGCMARCLELVETLEQQARRERDHLLPHVHTGVQVLRMQQAYAAG